MRIIYLYQVDNEMPHRNRFFFVSASFKNYSVAKAMRKIFALHKQKIIGVSSIGVPWTISNFIKKLVLLIFCLSFLTANAQSNWKKRKEKSGIVVYTREIEDSILDEFKGLITISNTSVNEVLNILTAIEEYPNWMPSCMGAKILQQNSKYHDIHYIEVKAPWPVSNRDAVYEMTTTVNTDLKFARIDLKPRGDYMEEKEGFVRLYKGTGFWELKETEKNKVEVTYQFLGDPGGKVPAWLANSYIVTNPYQTLTELRKLVEKK